VLLGPRKHGLVSEIQFWSNQSPEFGPRFRPPIVVAILNICTAEISPKRVTNFYCLKRSDFGGFQSPEVREPIEVINKSPDSCILFSLSNPKNIQKDDKKICTLLLVFSHIWLNLPRDDRHINKKSFQKKTLIWRNPVAATALSAIPFSGVPAAPPVPVDSAA